MNNYFESKTKNSVILSTGFKLEAIPIMDTEIFMELPLNDTKDTRFYFEILCLTQKDSQALGGFRREVFFIVHMLSRNAKRDINLLENRAHKVQGYFEANSYDVSAVDEERLGAIFRQTQNHRCHAIARPSKNMAAHQHPGVVQAMSMTVQGSLSVLLAKSYSKMPYKEKRDAVNTIKSAPQDVYRAVAFLTADSPEDITRTSVCLPNWQEHAVPSSSLPRIQQMLHTTMRLIQQERDRYPLHRLDQIAYLLRLPTGTKTYFPNSMPVPVINNLPLELLVKGDDGQRIGSLLGLRRHQDIFLHPEHLAKHTAILGASGSGKTSLLLNFMYECYRSGAVNCLTLDVEGYDLKNIASRTNADIYTAGGNVPSPYPINPFDIVGLDLNDTREVLKEVLTNALDDLWGPNPQFILDMLGEMYKTDFHLKRSCKTFIEVFDKQFDKFNHYGRNQEEMKMPCLVRLRKLSELSGDDSPFNGAELVDRNTIIELGRIALDNRLFALCFILKAVISIQKKRYSRRQPEGKPLFIIIDEAHVVLQKNGDSKASAYLISLMESIIKEGRKYGLYLLVSDQSPRLLHDIIPNINCKICMKVEEDVEKMGGFLRSEDAVIRLPVLKTGWAYLRVANMDGALLINSPKPMRLQSMDDEAVRRYMLRRNRLKEGKRAEIQPTQAEKKGTPLNEIKDAEEAEKIRDMADTAVDFVLNYLADYQDNTIKDWFQLKLLISDQHPKDLHLLPKVAEYLAKRFKNQNLSFIYKL